MGFDIEILRIDRQHSGTFDLALPDLKERLRMIASSGQVALLAGAPPCATWRDQEGRRRTRAQGNG